MTRDAHDERVAQATADALMALEVRADAERSLRAATVDFGAALRTLLSEDVSKRPPPRPNPATSQR